MAATPTPASAAPSRTRRVRPAWALLGGVLFAVGLLGAWELHRARRAAEADQRQLLAAQAAGLEANLSQHLVAAAGALRALRDELAQWPAEERAARAAVRLKSLQAAMPGARMLLLVGADGRVLASNQPDTVGRDTSEREFFSAPRAQPDADRLWLSRPFVGRSGRHLMALSLMVPAPGSGATPAFGGTLTMTLDSDYFGVLLRSSLYAPDMWAAAGHGDGIALAYEPSRPELSGQRVDKPGSFFTRHRDSGQPATVLVGLVAATGEYRMMAQRSVAPPGLGLDKPIVVAISRSMEAIHAPWWRQLTLYLGLYGLLVVSSLAALAVLQRRQRAIEQLEIEQAAQQQRSAHRLELALQGGDLGLWDLDVASGDATVNERWNSMLGLPHVELDAGSARWRSLVHPDDLPRVMAANQAHLEGRTPRFEHVYRMKHADGHWLWIQDRAQVLERDAQGRALRMVGTHLDITEAMQARLALERSEQHLATTLDSIGDAVITTDAEGRITRINTTAERLTGWPAAEALGLPLARVLRVVRGQTRAPVPDPAQQVLEHGTPVELGRDTLLLGRYGRETQIADSAAPIRAPDGQLRGVVLVFSDITDSHRVQETLRASEERLRRINRTLRVLSSGNLTLFRARDEETLLREVCQDIVRAGGFLMAWIGYAQEDEARSVTPMAAAGSGTDYLDDIRVSWDAGSITGQGPTGRTVRSGVPHINQNWDLNPEVAPWRERALARGFHASVALPLAGPERVFGALMVYAAEPDAFDAQEVAPLEELARNVSIAVLALRAQRQRDAAEGANRAKTLFLANISHEIRTPMNAIIGMNYLMRQSGVTPEQAERLDKIDAASRHLLGIVNDILDLSRIEAGGLALQSSDFHLCTILEGVHAIVSDAAAAKGVAVVVDAGDVPPWLRGDPIRLRQALLNFASNAVKFTEHGRVTIAAELLQAQGDALRVRFRVEDTGIGIAPEALERVFLPFEQGEPGTAGRHGGAGLGLAIAERLARLMGGEAGASSQPGAGSTFWFTVPLQRGQGQPAPLPDPQADGGAEALLKQRHAGARVLLVEDNEVNREIALAMLERLGLVVDAAADGAQAVALAQAHRYALVLMDVQMPVLDGLAATRAIRALPGGALVPVVALTANASDEDRRACAAAGMDDVLPKPMDVQELHRTLLKWLAIGVAPG